jgi:hypothetical protein
MIAYWELPRTHLLVMIAANLEPLRLCSDGRWRTVDRFFPVDGLEQRDVKDLESQCLIEFCAPGAMITEIGRTMLSREPSGSDRTSSPVPEHLPPAAVQ